MPDRLVRDELLESERWLDLPSDTHRLAFVVVLLQADDFGNFEGGPRRLFRLLHSKAQVKTEEATVSLMSTLQDADLARRYEVDGREFWHLPRFRNDRNYWVRRVPASPWCDPTMKTGRQSRIQGLAKSDLGNVAKDYRNVSGGVGVGVGVGEKKEKKRGARFAAPTLDEVRSYIAEKGYSVDAEKWHAHYTANGWKVGRNPMADWRAAVRTWAKRDIPAEESWRRDLKLA